MPVQHAVVALYCEDAHLGARVRSVLRRHCDFIEGQTWEELTHLAALSSCTVLIPKRESLACVAGLRRLHPGQPLVIIRRRDGRAVSSRGRWTNQEVVAFRDVDQELGPAVSRALLGGMLEQMASAVERDPRVPPLLRAAIARVYRARPPIRSVKELAAQLGCHPRTLEYHWHDVVPPVRKFRLHDLLGWMLLLHATTERLDAASWKAVADALGVGSQTLTRLGRTLADRSLREIAALGQQTTLPLFRMRVAAP